MLKNVALKFLSAQTVTGIIPFIMLPIYAKHFSPQEYGVYGLSLLIISFINGIGNMGLSTVFERNFHDHKSEKVRINYLFTIILFVAIILCFMGILSFYFIESIISLINLMMIDKGFIFIGMCSVFLKSIQDYFLLYFKQNKESNIFIRIKVIESIGSNIIILLLIFSYNYKIEALFYGVIFASLINIFWSFFLLYSRLGDTQFEFKDLRPSLSLSLPLIPRIFFGVINTKFDKYFLGVIGSISGVGVYEIAQKIGSLVFLFQTSLENVFSPTVYSKMFIKSSLDIDLAKYLTPFFYYTTGFSVLICLFAQEIFAIFFPIEYHDGIYVTIILSVLYATYFFGKIPQLLYARKTYLISVLTLINIVFNIGFNLYLIPLYGINGAAFATFTSGIITGLLSFYFSQKYAPISWDYMFIFYILFFLFLSVVIVFYFRFNDLSYFYLLPIKLILIFSYFLLGLHFRINFKLNY